MLSPAAPEPPATGRSSAPTRTGPAHPRRLRLRACGRSPPDKDPVLLDEVHLDAFGIAPLDLLFIPAAKLLAAGSNINNTVVGMFEVTIPFPSCTLG